MVNMYLDLYCIQIVSFPKTLIQVHHGLGGCHQNSGGWIPRHWGIEGWSLPHEIGQRWLFVGWWSKKVWCPAWHDIRTILSICTLIEPPFIITFFQFKLLPQKSGCWAVLRTRSRRPRWRASSANFVGCPSSLFDCLQTVLPVPGAARWPLRKPVLGHLF